MLMTLKRLLNAGHRRFAAIATSGLTTLLLLAAVPAFCQEETLKVVITQGGIDSKADIHLPGDKVGKTLGAQCRNELDLPQSGASVVFEVRPGVQVENTNAPVVETGKKAKKPKKASVKKTSKPAEPAAVWLEKDQTKVERTSDPDGNATVGNVFGNKIKGPSSVSVACSFEGKTGSVQIPQLNDRGPFCTTKCKVIIAGTLAGTGIVLYEILKPGPPTASINIPSVTATTGK